MTVLRLLWLSFFFILLHSSRAQQVSDTAFTYIPQQSKKPLGKGSIVWIDAAHENFHTMAGRYAPFAKVLQQDGYLVYPNSQPFSAANLESCDILVISNALHLSNVNNWNLPNPSAFTDEEIRALNQWVKEGGRLFLIADHMPFAGAAQALGQSFGILFLNCFALDNQNRPFERFYQSNSSLHPHVITQGIDTVVTFTGSAFKIPAEAMPLLALKDYTLKMPAVAWQLDENCPSISGEGYFQGATMIYGSGRLVIMGEAAMFSAQLAGPNRKRVGMNTPEAAQNALFLLQIMQWLDE
ncbi:MAG: DUF4350 domain-containing protein [Saprospiraceae bacterium]|nr:DUF4350 domain-containing protein [Saprospiraceae bacterium]